MSILFLTDQNGHPIPVLGFKANGTQAINATASASSINFNNNDEDKIVTLYATGDVRFVVGGTGDNANLTDSPFLAAGHYLDIPVDREASQLSVIAAAADCTVYVMERT